MTTKESLQAELEYRSEDDLAELLRLAQARTQAARKRKPGLLSKLWQVQIDAPADFASRLTDSH